MTIPTGFGQVTHFFTGTALPSGGATTYGIENPGPLTAIARAELAHDLFALHILPNITSDVFLDKTLVKLGPDATGPSAEWSDPTAGTISPPTSPPNTTYLVRKSTGLGGRSGRGRMYLPGVEELAVDEGGGIVSARVTALQSDCDDFLTALATANMSMYLLHEGIVGPTLVTSLDVASRAATQRRRLRR